MDALTPDPTPVELFALRRARQDAALDELRRAQASRFAPLIDTLAAPVSLLGRRPRAERTRREPTRREPVRRRLSVDTGMAVVEHTF